MKTNPGEERKKILTLSRDKGRLRWEPSKRRRHAEEEKKEEANLEEPAHSLGHSSLNSTREAKNDEEKKKRKEPSNLSLSSFFLLFQVLALSLMLLFLSRGLADVRIHLEALHEEIRKGEGKRVGERKEGKKT